MEDKIIQNEPINVPEQNQVIDEKPIKINKKTIIIFAIVIIFLILVYVFKGLFIAATVNGSPISRFYIIEKLEKASGKDLLDSLITEKLVKNEATKNKIIISNEEVDAQIKIISDQIVAQGSTLDVELAAQGASISDLREQIMFQKQLEKLVADKVSVTDEEIQQYIEYNKIEIPDGQEMTINDQIRTLLRNNKLNTEVQALVDGLKSKAKINYFVKY